MLSRDSRSGRSGRSLDVRIPSAVAHLTPEPFAVSPLNFSYASAAIDQPSHRSATSQQNESLHATPRIARSSRSLKKSPSTKSSSLESLASSKCNIRYFSKSLNAYQHLLIAFLRKD